MDIFIQSLTELNGIQLKTGNRVFSPKARYYPALDFLMYLNKDCSYRADRVDSWLTLLLDPQEDVLVGLRLKGFKFLFERLKAIKGPQQHEISKWDWKDFISFLEVALTLHGEDLLKDISQDLKKKYADARQFAEKEKINIESSEDLRELVLT